MAPPPSKASLPPVALPKFGDHFDAFNSSSTGHQRAENRLGGSTGWRESRSMKLSHQFQSGGTGGRRISDQVGAGSDLWDEKTKSLVPRGVGERPKPSVRDMLVGRARMSSLIAEGNIVAKREREDAMGQEQSNGTKCIFDGLVIYINGSTYPLISDHKLKNMLVENGAKLSIHLGRRQVTHVILGTSSGAGGGAGGGLAGSKIEKEIRNMGSRCAIKYVGVEWVLESMKAGKRLSETPFAKLELAAKGQQSVYSIFKGKRSGTVSAGNDS